LSKYNAKKITVDCIQFDSRLEAKYYEKLKKDVADNKILNFDLQPDFEVQPKFTLNGKNYRAIKYIADFIVYHNDGRITVIDIKGLATETAKIKKKLYEYNCTYPLKWLVWYQKSWMDYTTVQKIKRDRKKLKELG
jgi:hypothetical protein